MFKPRFSSLAELLEHDSKPPLESGEFDDNVWMLLGEIIESVDALDNVPHPVALYFASRYLEWEVGNGGFAQAAYNIPDWFEAAAIGYAEGC